MTESKIEELPKEEHRSPSQYVLIGAVLCGLTALEISLY